MGIESCFRDILRLKFQLVIPGSQIESAKVFSTGEIVKQIINARQGKLVLHRDLIQTSIIDAHAQGAIRIRHKQNGGVIGKARLFDAPIVQCHFDLLFDLCLFLRRQPKRRPVMRH